MSVLRAGARARGTRRPAATSLRARIFLTVLAVSLLAAGSSLVTSAIAARRAVERDARAALARQVDLLSAREATAPIPDPQVDELGAFARTQEQSLAVLALDQAVFLLPPEAEQPLLAGHRAEGVVEVRGAPHLYAARATGGRAVVILRPQRSASSDWQPYLVGFVAAGLGGAALAALLALALVPALSRPISQIVEATRRLAAGEPDVAVKPVGPAEVVALAESLNELSGALARARAAERSFLLSVSHELKTPLTGIRGHAEGIADGLVEPEAGAAVIQREAGRLERLVGDLLLLARLRQHSFAVEDGRVELRGLLADLGERHHLTAARYRVELRIEAGEAGVVRGDHGRALQLVSNLVENAVRCTPAGGTVEVRATGVAVTVTDTGLGLDPGDLERAFEQFYLWSKHGHDRAVGTGLGLSIVHALAAAMGAAVTVSSTPGTSTTFTVAFQPAAAPARSTMPGRRRFARPLRRRDRPRTRHS